MFYRVYFEVYKKDKKIREQVRLPYDGDMTPIKLTEKQKSWIGFHIGYGLLNLLNTDLDNDTAAEKFIATWVLDPSEDNILRIHKDSFMSGFNERGTFTPLLFTIPQEHTHLINHIIPMLLPKPDISLAIGRVMANKLEWSQFEKLLSEIGPPIKSLGTYRDELNDMQKRQERKLEKKRVQSEINNLLEVHLPKHRLRFGFTIVEFFALCYIELAFILSIGLSLKKCPNCSICFIAERRRRKYCDDCSEKQVKVKICRQKKGVEERRQYDREYMRDYRKGKLRRRK